MNDRARNEGMFHEEPPIEPDPDLRGTLDQSDKWDEMLARIDHEEWLTLPGGGKIHLPSLGGPCPQCGARVFYAKDKIRGGGGLCCPRCLPIRDGTPIRGWFDVVERRIVPRAELRVRSHDDE